VWVKQALEQASIEQGTQRRRVPPNVYVRCYDDRWSFESVLLRMGAAPLDARLMVAYYVPSRHGGGDASTVNMRAGTCKLANEFVAGHVTQETAGAFKTLLHEALHRQGFHTEKTTELYAIASMQAAGELVALALNPDNAGSDPRGPFYAAGERAKRLAWQQSRAWGARRYVSQWSEVRGLSTSWWDAIDLGHQIGEAP
jgi:hypothetical protein